MTTPPSGPAGATGLARPVRLAAIGVAVALYAWPAGIRLFSEPPAPPAFLFEEPAAPPRDQEPVYYEEFVCPQTTAVHVGSICELADGTLASTWYAGSREGALDTSICFATRAAAAGSAWTEPRAIVTRDSAARELSRFVLKVGNPLLFADREDRLWLIYVSSAIGGWSASSLNVKTSTDGGDTWTKSRRLTLSPYLNISELVRNKPVMLEGGGFVVAIYHENIAVFPEMLWMRGDPDGRAPWRKTRITGGRAFLQPAVVPLGRLSAVAFFRSKTSEKAIGISWTSDAGLTWTDVGHTGLPHPEAGLDALYLRGGRILLAFNDSTSDRSNLRLAISRDRAATWTRVATIEEKPEKTFSYPYMVRTRDGLVHLVFTWRRERIKHVVFNEAWLDEEERKALRGEAHK